MINLGPLISFLNKTAKNSQKSKPRIKAAGNKIMDGKVKMTVILLRNLKKRSKITNNKIFKKTKISKNRKIKDGKMTVSQSLMMKTFQIPALAKKEKKNQH